MGYRKFPTKIKASTKRAMATKPVKKAKGALFFELFLRNDSRHHVPTSTKRSKSRYRMAEKMNLTIPPITDSKSSSILFTENLFKENVYPTQREPVTLLSVGGIL